MSSLVANTILHPDAKLIELGQCLNVVCDALRRCADDESDSLYAVLGLIEDAIIERRAVTIEGFAVKARAATRWGLAPGDIADDIAKSLVRDLLQFDSERRATLSQYVLTDQPIPSKVGTPHCHSTLELNLSRCAAIKGSGSALEHANVG